MEIYKAGDTKKKVLNPQDPSAIVDYGMRYKPEVWQAGENYEESINIVRPTIHNGYEYHVVSNGISGDIEPAWPTKKGVEFSDGTVQFKSFNYKSFLRPEETLKAGTGSSWTATSGVTIASDTFTTEGETDVRVGPIPNGVDEFEITNHVIEASGRKDDRTLVIKVKDR